MGATVVHATASPNFCLGLIFHVKIVRHTMHDAMILKKSNIGGKQYLDYL
jgi:hypothetical protein